MNDNTKEVPVNLSDDEHTALERVQNVNSMSTLIQAARHAILQTAARVQSGKRLKKITLPAPEEWRPHHTSMRFSSSIVEAIEAIRVAYDLKYKSEAVRIAIIEQAKL